MRSNLSLLQSGPKSEICYHFRPLSTNYVNVIARKAKTPFIWTEKEIILFLKSSTKESQICDRTGLDNYSLQAWKLSKTSYRSISR